MKLVCTFALVIFLISLDCSSAQQRRPKKPNSQRRYAGAKSPFKESGERDHAVQTAPKSQHRQASPPKKSPFSPPTEQQKSRVVVPKARAPPPPQTPQKSPKQSAPENAHPNKNTNKPVVHQASPKDRQSPFNPPTQEEWRKAVAAKPRQPAPTRKRKPEKVSHKKRPSLAEPESTLEEPFSSHHDELQSIPPLASIEVKPRRKSANHNVRGRRRPRPKLSPYQDTHGHRDIHDVGPGVTPWTRYTSKPRPSGTDKKIKHTANARCGTRRYSPRNQMCCQGHLVRRQGLKPSCCGNSSYDMAFNKCCDGVISFRSASNPEC